MSAVVAVVVAGRVVAAVPARAVVVVGPAVVPAVVAVVVVVVVVDVAPGNVFAHTPDGTAYAVRVRAGGGRATLVVEDAGPGIEAPRAAVGRGASRPGSTGLGLDIARRAAEAAGGGLAIDRSPLGGARVTLDLPLAARRP